MLPPDKMVHFLAGAVIAFVVAMLSNPIAGMCAALAVGFIKELVIDVWVHKGVADPWDIVATFVGGVTVTLPIYVKAMA